MGDESFSVEGKYDLVISKNLDLGMKSRSIYDAYHNCRKKFLLIKFETWSEYLRYQRGMASSLQSRVYIYVTPGIKVRNVI
jgi:hypothetical protein